MFQINPNIPLQALANPVNFADSLTKAQDYETNALRLQALRDEYNAAKEERDRQKAMRQGVASELQKMQQGTPAQYRTTFPQTMPTGQMPKGMTGVLASGGMTGVLASERGQKLPQPALFGENILQGNFDINRELVSPAVKGREPTYLEQLQIAAKQALKAGDVDSAFKFSQAMQQQRIAEREQNAPVGNPYPVYDTSGNFVGTRIMTKSGQEKPFGQQGTTTVKPDVLSAKDKAEIEFQERKFGAEQTQKQKEYNLEYKKYIADLNKPDAVEKALAIAEGKEKIKQESEQRAKVAEKYADAEAIEPILKQLITQLDDVPKAGISRDIQSGLEYFGAGNEKQQNAMAALKNTEALLVPFAQKQTGPQSDKDVQQYKEQVAAAANPLARASSRKKAAENALFFAQKVKQKYGKYASKILSGEVTPDELKTEPSEPTRSKDELFQLKKEYEFNRKKYKDDPEVIKILDSKARELGLIK